MCKRYFVQTFHYTLKLLKYQWNMMSKETPKLNNMKTAHNKSFKSKLKVNLASVTSVKKANT